MGINTFFINIYVVFNIRYSIFYVKLIVVATLVKYFGYLSNMLGSCLTFMCLYNLSGALYSLSGLCRMFLGLPPPPLPPPGPTAAAAVAPRRAAPPGPLGGRPPGPLGGRPRDRSILQPAGRFYNQQVEFATSIFRVIEKVYFTTGEPYVSA